MYSAQAFQQYRAMQTQTADGGELVVMLYEGAIRFLVRAATALDARNVQESHNNLVRAQDIVIQLMTSLNKDTGEIAENLFKIYEYMYYRLVQANIKKDRAGVDEVAHLLRELLPAWQTAAKAVRANQREHSPVANVAQRYIAV